MSSDDNGVSFGETDDHSFKVPMVYWDQAPVHTISSMCTTSNGVITGGDNGELVAWKWVQSDDATPKELSATNQVRDLIVTVGI
jgi:hypothetical protein